MTYFRIRSLSMKVYFHSLLREEGGGEGGKEEGPSFSYSHSTWQVLEVPSVGYCVERLRLSEETELGDVSPWLVIAQLTCDRAGT